MSMSEGTAGFLSGENTNKTLGCTWPQSPSSEPYRRRFKARLLLFLARAFRQLVFSTIIGMVGLESAILFCVFYFLHVVTVLLLFLERSADQEQNRLQYRGAL